MMASMDPVAIDQASLDIINKAAIIPNSILGGKPDAADKLKQYIIVSVVIYLNMEKK